MDVLRKQIQPPDPLAFALPFADDPLVVEKIQSIRAGEKQKWARVDDQRFEEAAYLRERLIAEVKSLREYCSKNK